ncbi:MAG: hypothetical protein JW913_15905 [Chitinispirillaceae bacterium]|nr:hypothetical protein [Chitinispirillaceae bacterium]
MNKNTLLTIVYVVAVVLLFLRVDFWWWGTKIHPILAGWITLPMLYQLGIWAAGTALVYIVCLVVWKDEPQQGGK